MKKLILTLILGVMLMASLMVVSAAINVDDVTLDGGSNVVVHVGDTPLTEVTVTTSGIFDNWESTSYMIEGGGWTCVNTADHTIDGTYAESFTITIPALSAGDYDFSVRTWQYTDDCSDMFGYGDSFTLSDGITVEESPCEITIDDPLVGNYYMDDVPITWSLGLTCTSPSYNLHYYEGSCTPGSPTDWVPLMDSVNELFYDWTSGFNEGEFCVRVSEDEGDDFGVMDDTFFIDNLNPIAEADGPYSCDEGDDVWFSGIGSYDPGLFPSGIDTLEWSVDGSYVGSGWLYNYDCLDGDATLDVELVVTDNVGREGSDISTVDIYNVDPVCTGISAPFDAAVEQPVVFDGSATDVPADMPKLEFNWDFDDGDTATNEDPVTHIFTSDDSFTVELTVLDTDGGSDTCLHKINIVEPTPLDNQEVAAYYELDADFGTGAGVNPNTFATGLTGVIACDKVISSPAGMDVGPDGDDCLVEWNSPMPFNDQQGDHPMIVRVEDSLGDYEYYSFATTVYSWMIPMEDGWNFFSIPLVPSDTSVEEVVFNEDYDLYDYIPGYSEYVLYSYQFDGASSAWLSSRRSGLGDLDNVVPGYGYWLKIDNPEDDEIFLKGFGSQMPQQQSPPGAWPEIEVPTNHWSMIGRYGIVSDDDDDDGYYNGKNNALNTLTLLGYSSQLNLYRVFDSGGYWQMSSVDDLYNNNAYWLWLEDNSGFGSQAASYSPAGDDYYEYNGGEWPTP